MKSMEKIIGALALCLVSGMLMAGAEQDCSGDAIADADKAESCLKQANDALNDAYDQLKTTHQDSKDKLELLKKMQLGWIQMRDNQCEFAMHNTGSNAAMAAILCQIDLTTRRATELQDI